MGRTELEAREIDRHTVTDIIRLRVREDQEGLLASNAVTIAQAAYEERAWLRGLWVGETPVGLLAMIDLDPTQREEDDDEWPEDAAYLWRLMIAAEHQGKGYGRRAVELAYAQARRWGRGTVCVHVAEDEGNAMDFYRRFGLEPTGRIDDGERLLMGPVPAKG